MFFASDNTGPAHPEVMQALMAANEGYMPSYGADPITRDVEHAIRTLFEAPEAAVFLVATGTSGNALALAALSQPWQTIFCSAEAHLHTDECNAPEFFSGGARLTLVGDGDKIDPEALRVAIEAQQPGDVHVAQRGPVSLTNVTEKGQVYCGAELAALCDVAKGFGLPVHLDGARFANACVATNLSPAEMTWRAGVDALTFGGTKNGLLDVEAVIFFDPAHARDFAYRRKRGGHLVSKHRFLSAQMQAYLRDDLWRRTAAAANAKAGALATGLRARGIAFTAAPQANVVFCEMPRRVVRHLKAKGAQLSVWSGTLDGPDPEAFVELRLVCDWSLPEDEITRFLALLDAR